MEDDDANKPLDVDLTSYLKDFPKNKLSLEEESRIGKLPFDHSERWKLVTHNMRFGISIAIKRFKGNKNANDFQSILQVAQDALIESSRKFKSRGVRFVSYAFFTLNRDISREIVRQSNAVHIPHHKKAMEIDRRKILLIDGKENIMLEKEIENSLIKGKVNGIDLELDIQHFREDFNKALNLCLTDREKDIILMRFVDNKKLREIAEKYGICIERVRQIISASLKKLRKTRIFEQYKDLEFH